MARMKQIDRVVAWLKDNKSVNRVEALKSLGIANLPAVISDMREKGYQIVTVETDHINQFGERTTKANYYFKGDEPNAEN
ncbi:MAG: helix-turn-helix domain-containing protein [Clostridia bacterium]|nr:helix-turn-helix domain-containing protein [Clostridia bacterium]